MDIKKTARKAIFNIKPYKPGKPVEELKRQMNLKNVYKLASNENPLGPSPRAMAAMRKELPLMNRYPDGASFYLRQGLAKKYRLGRDNIIIGNGSDELIVLTLRAFVNRGDEVIIATPTFLVYKIASELCEAKVVSVPQKAFRYDLEAMRAKITSRTKVIFIANPDNPTGSYVTKDEVEKFLRGLPRNVVVFFDEAYYEYLDRRDYPQTLKYLGRNNIIVSRSFSKIYGLSGLRIGWAAAGKDIIRCLNQVREPFNVNRMAQAAALAAINDKRHVQRSSALVKKERTFLCSEFKRLGLFFVPSVTNFVLLNVGQNSEQLYLKLLKKGIIVREMTAWGLKNFIRVTIGTVKENRLFLKNLKKMLKK